MKQSHCEQESLELTENKNSIYPGNTSQKISQVYNRNHLADVGEVMGDSDFFQPGVLYSLY